MIIGIKLADMNLIGKGEEISKLKGVISVSVVAGRYDLLVLFKKILDGSSFILRKSHKLKKL